MPTQRFPLFSPFRNRDNTGTKDSKLVNCYLEIEGQDDPAIVKRPGLTLNTSVAAGQGLGIFSWKGHLFEARGTTLYKDGIALGTINSSGGRYYFTLTTITENRLFLKNTTNAYYINSDFTFHAVTDVDYPALTVPGVASMDGYIFVMTPTGEIHNGDLENCSSWQSLNYITAEIEADNGVFITKYLNYVVAMKQWSTEFFYDAANALGSPLATTPNLFVKVGCATADSVISTGQTLVWMGQTQEKSRSLQFMEGFVPKDVANGFVHRIFDGDPLTTVYSYGIKIAGRDFYLLTLVASNVTILVDATTKSAYYWSSGSSDNYFNGISYTVHNGNEVIQGETDGNTYLLSPSAYQDNGVQINTRVVTPIMDMQSNKNKFISCLQVIGDKVTSTIQMRYSDDDYQTYSSWVSVDLSTNRSQAYRLGRTRRRSWEFLHTDNTPLRLIWMEIDFDTGSS